MKIYHMIIAREPAERFGDRSTRREYRSTRQSSAPPGWICLGVCGYHETPGRKRDYDGRDDYRPEYIEED